MVERVEKFIMCSEEVREIKYGYSPDFKLVEDNILTEFNGDYVELKMVFEDVDTHQLYATLYLYNDDEHVVELDQHEAYPVHPVEVTKTVYVAD